MTKKKRSLIVLLLVLLLGACSSGESSSCSDILPAKGFSESDLVGTWGGLVETLWDSIIIIRGDGRYKQIMDIKRTGFSYESGWKLWHVTYSDTGLPYLHLEGFLMCAYWRQVDCHTGKTGIEPVEVGDTRDTFSNTTEWYDVCQKKWIDTPGEGVFMVIEGGKLAPRGIVLLPLTKSASGVSGPYYELQEP